MEKALARCVMWIWRPASNQLLQVDELPRFYQSPYEVAQEEIREWCELHNLRIRCLFDVDLEACEQVVV